MKPSLPVVLAGLLLCLTACEDECHQIRTYRNLSPFYITAKQLRETGVSITSPRELEDPGKIYLKDNYLFINEVKKGIHIIDNSNPEQPRKLSFLSILGNSDMAVKGNILYADSYTDFLVFDISDPANPLQIQRIENAFSSGMVEGINWYLNTVNTDYLITDYTANLETIVTEMDCETGTTGAVLSDFVALSNSYSSIKASGSTGQGSGTGGSMARFAIVNDILYAVTNQNMQLFDISQPAYPQKGNMVSLGWGIETIFPYGNALYVGTTTGVQILSNIDPVNPVRVSTISHIRACDPVVVQNNYAYVTLRAQEGSWCGDAQSNQLDLIDVSNIYSPKLIKSFPMQSPYGLGIDNQILHVCEGSYGLKTYSITEPLQLDKNMINQLKSIKAYDVIPLSNQHVLMIGKDGFYQYDFTNPTRPRLLSLIPVLRKDSE
ncbi:MAG: hypothetical protein QM669_02885 [Siphonobacter sp.]